MPLDLVKKEGIRGIHVLWRQSSILFCNESSIHPSKLEVSLWNTCQLMTFLGEKKVQKLITGIFIFSEPLFWQPRSHRYHYISKTCDTLTHCQQESTGLGVRCMKDWYRDWTCVECCQGDRCNYYTTVSETCVENF